MTENLCHLGFTTVKMWKCQLHVFVKAKNINIKCPDLKHINLYSLVTVFNIKRQDKVDGNKGLEGHHLAMYQFAFLHCTFDIWNKVSINILNKDLALASFQKPNSTLSMPDTTVAMGLWTSKTLGHD